MKLHIADNLSLPLEAVTQTFAALARRGRGKTYTASVIAEELLAAGQQIVAIDPTGAWWGLRSEYPIVVLGGDHADLPLEEGAGELLARAIVEERFSAVIDLSAFRKGQIMRFMVAFAETLYRLNRQPLHLFVDEADAVAPQSKTFGGDEPRMLGAMGDIVRRGRKRGIGCTLITQRPAVISKNVLTQCDSLFALGLSHPIDIKAVMEWINVHADPDQAKQVIESLPTMGIGEAWFWSPAWLGVLKRVKIRERRTFDSSATPKAGQKIRPPKTLAKLDVAALGAQIQAAAERAKADDPKELRRKIAQLEKDLVAAGKSGQKATAADPARIAEARADERARVHARLARLMKTPFGQVLANAERAVKELEAIQAKVVELASTIAIPDAAAGPVIHAAPTSPLAPDATNGRPFGDRHTSRTAMRSPTPSAAGEASDLPKGEAKILARLIQFPDGLRREQLTVMTGYKRSSRDTYLQRLRERGLVETAGELVTASESGRAALPHAEPLPIGAELRACWLGCLPEGERVILEKLIEAWPDNIDRERLSEETGYKRSSRDTYLQRMRAKQLITEPERGCVAASPTLFD